MKVLVGVTGGIAAYKALSLVRLFVQNGDEVQVVMTQGAKAFVQPLSFQALSGKPVRDELFDARQEAGMGHIELARWADVIVIAPATAETLAKLRMGRADDLLMTLCLATEQPIVLAPAMNRLMWANAATQENVAILKQRGVYLMSPAKGQQACGEVGAGRLPEPEAIFDQVQTVLHKQLQSQSEWRSLKAFWQNKRVLITAGPTHEPIDPVRYIANRSSGKMGFAIAEMAAQAGAEVTLIAGPVSLEAPVGVARIDIVTADELLAEVQAYYAQINSQAVVDEVFIATAAVADFKVAQVCSQKLKKQAVYSAHSAENQPAEMSLKLIQNPDILAWVASQQPKPFVVGFAAETEKVIEYAKDKLMRKNLDMICANRVGKNKGFGQDTNALTLIAKSNTQYTQKQLPETSKQNQAFELLRFIMKF